jgi:hypothetical protein
MIRQAAAGAAVLAVLVAGGSARAQVADLLRAKCADLMELRQNDRGQLIVWLHELIVWLHGYYAGAAQRPVIDRPKLEAAVTAIEKTCEQNRALALIGIEARAIFLGEPLPQVQPGASTSPSGAGGSTIPPARPGSAPAR